MLGVSINKMKSAAEIAQNAPIQPINTKRTLTRTGIILSLKMDETLLFRTIE